MIVHVVEQRRGALRTTITIDLGELLGHLDASPERLDHRLQVYLDKVRADILDVGQTLLKEGEVGKVKWFSESRGYGYIRTIHSEDVFVHWHGIRSDGYATLKEGQTVRFKRRQGRESVEAIDVVLEPAISQA